MTTCPHCGKKLIQHGNSANPAKVGAAHCNGCGCCFDAHGDVRDGHPPCAEGVTAELKLEKAKDRWEASAAKDKTKAEVEAKQKAEAEAKAEAAKQTASPGLLTTAKAGEQVLPRSGSTAPGSTTGTTSEGNKPATPGQPNRP